MFKQSLIALALVVGLSACEAQTTPAPHKAKDVAYSVTERTPQGFNANVIQNPSRKVTVYFDPLCPHCGDFWEASKALHDQVQFVWVPVSILSPSSVYFGAQILAADDPAAAMTAHEKALTSDSLAKPVTSYVNFNRQIMNNTKLFTAYKEATGVPFLVYVSASGSSKVAAGALPLAELRRFVDLP